MKVIGANIAATHFGMKLNDGGACLVENGKIVIAVSEERLTRSKHDAGFAKSIRYCLENTNNSVNDIDLFVISSCSEPIVSKTSTIPCKFPVADIETLGIPRDKIVVVRHHLSHAYSSFAVSPFDKAVIMVMDGEGNSVDEWWKKAGLIDIMASSGKLLGKKPGLKYWVNSLERQSYYLGDGNDVRLVDRESYRDEQGVGEVYRYFTNFLGFGAYVNAGKTMGLASYGNPGAFPDVELFRLDKNGHIRVLPKQEYENPNVELTRYFLENYDIKITPRLSNNDPIMQVHKDLAWLVQDRTNKIMASKASFLYDKYGIKNLCLAGGVALNSVTNKYLLDNTDFKNVFIQPASGDSGQCIGNAYYGYLNCLHGSRNFEMKTAYLGKQYTNADVVSAFEKHDLRYFRLAEPRLLEKTCSLITDGKIIGWFQGRSEIGPRALGNRSILCDPRKSGMKDKLNEKVKHRESFRPFAPSVILKHCHKFFDLECPSPFMLLVSKIKPGTEKIISAVVHVDNTARVQTVTEENGIYFRLLKKFYDMTLVPVLLNTSFNVASEPIVETPLDAVKCFLSTEIDCLVIHDFIAEK